MNSTYYVYYRVQPGDTADALAAVRTLQQHLAQSTGISGRLLRRRDDPSTWMGIYENVVHGESFEEALQRLVESRAFAAWLAPGSIRHQEVFREF